LERVALDEGGLKRMKSFGSAYTFDGYNFVFVVHDREGQARVYATAVDQNRTRAALTVITPFLGAGQV
jgi:hypothetical protein